jgi:hypothetical protein
MVNNTANNATVVTDTIGGSVYSVNVQNLANGNLVNYTSAAPSVGGWNYLGVTSTFTQSAWNTVAFHRILAVTGQCEVFLTPFITTSLAGATSTYSLGDVTGVSNYVGSTAVAAMTSPNIWTATTPVTSYIGANPLGGLHAITNGLNIGYTIGTAAATAGVILFACYWRPLAPASSIVAGTGQAN